MIKKVKDWKSEKIRKELSSIRKWKLEKDNKFPEQIIDNYFKTNNK